MSLNLEQQRKRAKDLRRVHREGSMEAAVRIARYLPRARNQSAEQVLASTITLSEAQFVVAREAGFSSWPKMKHHIEQAALTAAGMDDAIIEAALAGNDTGIPGSAQQSIHVAAVLAEVEPIFALLEKDPSLVHQRGGRRQWTPLSYLCASRYRRTDPETADARVRIARRLIELGADVNAAGKEVGFASWNVTLFDQEEWRPVDAAAVHAASPELVQLLLDAGADLNKTGAVLSQAVRGGNTEVLKVLLSVLPESLWWQVGWAAKASVLLNRADMAGMLAAYNAPRLLEGALLDAIQLERDPEFVEIFLGNDESHSSTSTVWRNAYRAARRFGQRRAAEVLRGRGIGDDVLTDVDRVIAACVNGDRTEGPHAKTAFREDDHRMLAWVIRTGRFHAVPLLLEVGLDPNIPDKDGETPLHLAVRANSIDTVETLLRSGARVDARNFDGERPLDLAITDHHEKLVQRLLEAGAHPAEESRQLDRDEMNLVFERAADAVAFGDIDTLREMLDEEPSLVHARSPRLHRATLLNYCGSNGVEEPRQRLPENAPAIMQLLLDRGSDVNATCNLYGGGATTLGLHLTSIYPMRTSLRIPMAEILLKAGAMLDGARGAEGIVGAAALGRLDVVRNFSNATKAQIQSAFMWACEFGRTDVVRFLVDKGADVTAQGGNGQTGLHAASLGGHMEIVKMLLERKAPLEICNVWGGTVLANTLWGAVNWDPSVDYVPIVKLLVDAGAHVDSDYLPWWEKQDRPSSAMKTGIAELLRTSM